MASHPSRVTSKRMSSTRLPEKTEFQKAVSAGSWADASRHSWPAIAAGLLVLGLEVLLLRRLPFWLEGLQPTLSGVVAACLLGLSAGSAFGTPLFAALFGRRAVYCAIAFGAVAVSAGLHEWCVPILARQSISSELGLHLRRG